MEYTIERGAAVGNVKDTLKDSYKSLKACVILNGPPGCGKDTIANLMGSKGFQHHRFKEGLYEETISHYGVHPAIAESLFTDREAKEVPSPLFGGLSPRGALIHVSEDIIKPTFGKEFFGWKAALGCVNTDSSLSVFSDGGFPEEIVPLAEVFEHVLIFHLHRDSFGFEGDSRNYVFACDVPRVNVRNFPVKLFDGKPKAAVEYIVDTTMREVFK